MSDVQIYTTTYCGFCRAAKIALDEMNVSYQEIDVTSDPEARRDLVVKANGRRTVPQIFIDGQPIGGFTDLISLKRSGRLSELLQRPDL